MHASRVALFAVLLFVLQTGVGALVIRAVGIEEIGRLLVAQSIVGTAVSICVFTYMSWAYPSKPFLSAFAVGVSAYLLGYLTSALIARKILWDPAILIFDAPLFLLALVVGVGLGAKLRQRRSRV